MVNFKEIIKKPTHMDGVITKAFYVRQEKISYLPDESIIAAIEIFSMPVKESDQVVIL